MSIYLGIDFGTSTNYVVRWDDKKKSIKEEQFGEYGKGNVIDNVIYYTELEEYIGHTALKKSTVDNPLNLVRYIKREIDKDNWTTYIPAINKHLTSKDIATHIFRKIKEKVEINNAGENVEGAVITVPFAFLYKEKQKIKQSALDAGIKVLGLIEEPVAAAIRYIDYNKNSVDNEKRNIMVFDLGGGTLDVTIFSCFKENDSIVLEVLNTDGDKTLGGKDVTDYLVDYFLDNLDIDIVNSVDDSTRREILKHLNKIADEVKQELSYDDECEVFEQIQNTWLLELEITNEDLSEILNKKNFTNKIIETIENSIFDAELEIDDIDKVILVGGSSKLSIVKEIISDKYNMDFEEFDNPDKLVAEGAAIYCGNILDENTKYKVIPRLSQSIGRNKDGKFYPMILKNSIYNTSSNTEWINIKNKENSYIDIYQGNSTDIKKCCNIGRVYLDFEIDTDKIGLQLMLDKEGIIRYKIYSENDMLDIKLVKEGEIKDGEI